MEMKFQKTVKFVVINLLENLDDGKETDSHLPSGRALYIYIYIREVSYHFPWHAMPLLGDQKNRSSGSFTI